MALITVEGLTKKYGDFLAVDNANFSIQEGEVFGLLGPNGAGKTSTINMIIGLARITAGSVNIDGRKYTDTVKQAQGLMGIVLDESNLYDELSGFENLCFCAALYGMDKKQREKRAAELLRQFGLDKAGNKPFKAYSKGMKRKLTIAAGIIHNPRILFLDEPTTGIDVASARHIRRLLQELNKNGTTIFLTTHYIEEAERLCDRIAFMVAGRIVRIGAVAELMAEAQKDTIVQFTIDKDVSEFREQLAAAFPDVTIELCSATTVCIRSKWKIDLMPFMRFFYDSGLIVYEARIMQPSLEEVFVQVTGVELQAMKQGKEANQQ